MKPGHLTATNFALLMRELIDGPCTFSDLKDALGLADSTLRIYLKALRAKRIIHISLWERDGTGRAQLAVYAFGDRDDACRPPPYSQAEKSARWRSSYHIKRLTQLRTFT